MKTTFTEEEIKIIKNLLKQLEEAAPSSQIKKNIRRKLRNLGFYITELNCNTLKDFESLIKKKIISISNTNQTKNTSTITIETDQIQSPDDLKIGLDPWIGNNPQVLILGILPGDNSIQHQTYYNDPRNAFWKIMKSLFNDYNDNDRKNFILSHHIALWDCLKYAHRQGSMDSGFKDEGVPNNLIDFLNCHPSIKYILLNGNRKTLKTFNKHFCSLQNSYKVIALRSSVCYIPLEEKIKEWNIIKELCNE